MRRACPEHSLPPQPRQGNTVFHSTVVKEVRVGFAPSRPSFSLVLPNCDTQLLDECSLMVRRLCLEVWCVEGVVTWVGVVCIMLCVASTCYLYMVRSAVLLLEVLGLLDLLVGVSHVSISPVLCSFHEFYN